MDDSTPIIDVTAHPTAGFVPNDDFWAFLRRRKGSISLLWFIGSVAGLWWLLSRPHFFEAESRIMIVRTGAGGPVSEAELASEIELIRDPSHLEKTAAKQQANSTDAQTHERLGKVIAALSVTTAGKSNLVAIQYRDPDPASAARAVNQIVELYLADRRFIFQTVGRPATTSGSRALDLLSAFDALNHGTQLQTELQSRVQRRLELENRVVELKAQIRDHQEGSVTLRKRLSSLPDRVRSQTRTRTPGISAPKQVEETEIINPFRQEIESSLLKNDTAIAGLRARVEETNTALAEARILEIRLSALTSEREKLERQAADSRVSTDPTNTADRPNLRATLINRAEAPYAPLPRYTALWSPVTLLAALLVAFVIAWLIDQFDKPIYTSGDFERASGVPPMDDFAHGAGA